MTDQLLLINPNPNPFIAYANTAVTAGAFVKAVSSNDVVSSSLSGYSADDIKVEDADDGSSDYITVVGIAGHAAAAGTYVSVYTKGLFIVRAGEGGGLATAGGAIQVAEDTNQYEVDALDTTLSEHKIGRALTAASAADKYLIILLRI